MTDDFALKNDVRVLTGQTAVSAGDWFRIFRVVIIGGTSNAGDVYLAENNFREAHSHYLHAAEISDQNQFQLTKAEILYGISQCFIGLEDQLQAKSYAESALELATATQQKDLQLKIKKSLQSLN